MLLVVHRLKPNTFCEINALYYLTFCNFYIIIMFGMVILIMFTVRQAIKNVFN